MILWLLRLIWDWVCSLFRSDDDGTSWLDAFMSDESHTTSPVPEPEAEMCASEPPFF